MNQISVRVSGRGHNLQPEWCAALIAASALGASGPFLPFSSPSSLLLLAPLCSGDEVAIYNGQMAMKLWH